MKTLLCMLLIALLTNSTEAIYKNFRVVKLTQITEAPPDLTGDSIIDAKPARTYWRVSFTCDPGKSYMLEASESLGEDADWFPIRVITAGQQFTTLTQVDGEDIVTLPVPMPFMPELFTSGRGFLRVLETSKEPLPDENDYAPITGLTNHGDYISVTFLSEPFCKYLIKGATVPASPDSDRWCPVDTYWNGHAIPTLSVYSTGEETTVDLANSLLPWILKDGGYLLIHKKPVVQQPTASAQTFAAVIMDEIWTLMTTRNGNNDPSVRFKDLGWAGISGQIAVILDATGPKMAEHDKYMVIKASGRATLKGLFVPDTEIRMPRIEDPQNPDESQAQGFIRLSFYEYTDDRTVPEIKFEPNPDKHNGTANNFEFHLMIQSGSVIGVAAYKPEESLGDKLKLEPLGVGFSVNVPENGGQVIADKNWQFSPMTRKTMQAFMAAMSSR